MSGPTKIRLILMKVVSRIKRHVIAIYSTWNWCKVFIPGNVSVVYVHFIILVGAFISGELEEIKRNIEDRSDKQKVSLREIITETCSAVFDIFKKYLMLSYRM